MPDLDAIMEQASVALAQGRYLTCEARCLEALALARQQRDWGYYARVLLPLQESRRHRRHIAADDVLRLGTGRLTGDPTHWLDGQRAACIVVTQPHAADAARLLVQTARRRELHVEVLWADCDSAEPRWTLHSFAGPDVTCMFPAPPGEWVERWLAPLRPAPAALARTAVPATAYRAGRADQPPLPPPDTGAALALRPADWFIDAGEALGDAALAQVDDAAPAWERLQAIERCLEVVTDHEIIHQRLWAAARQAQRAPR